jgi:hypothetical protein
VILVVPPPKCINKIYVPFSVCYSKCPVMMPDCISMRGVKYFRLTLLHVKSTSRFPKSLMVTLLVSLIHVPLGSRLTNACRNISFCRGTIRKLLAA